MFCLRKYRGGFLPTNSAGTKISQGGMNNSLNKTERAEEKNEAGCRKEDVVGCGVAKQKVEIGVF